MVVAVILGIVGASKASSSNPQEGEGYRTASTVIFLVLTVILAVQTVRLTFVEGMQSSIMRTVSENQWLILFKGRLGFRSPKIKTLGCDHGAYILCIIAILLLVRELFTTATVGNSKENERLWYPLFALPELLAVAFYAIPGLVPPRSELPK